MDEKKILDELAAIKQQLSQVTTLMNAMAMAQNLRDLASKLDQGSAGSKLEAKAEVQLSHAEQLDRLETATEVKFLKEHRFFLLHRPTETAEFEASEKDGGEYKTTTSTTWYAAMPRASDEQGPGNPLVSVWVGEVDIVEVRHAAANNAQYGEAMDNPAAQKYEIEVKPGEYEIYAEVKHQ